LADDLVTIYRFRGSEEAYLWKEKIKTNGIKSVVIHDFHHGADLPSNELQVKASDVKRARKILKPLRKIGPVPATLASLWLVLVFGIIMIIPGIIFLIFADNTGALVAGAITSIIGGFFIIFSLLEMVRRKKANR
jgi:hypothetical protein